jgi:chemotaxis protein histidine kinase CheA
MPTRRRPAGRALARALVALALAALPATTLGTAPATASTVESEPTRDQIDAKQSQVQRMDREVTTRRTAVQAAQAELAADALAAGEALQRYSEAARALAAAEQENQRQQDLLRQADLDLATQRHLLGRWAREAYRDGAALGGNLGVVSLLGAQSTDDVGTTMAWLRRVGDSRSRAVDAFEHAQAVQAAAAAQAAAASEAAAAATLAAADAKTQADAAVAAQRQTVARLEQALADSQTKASALRSELAETRASFQMALGMSASTYRTGGNRVVGPVGSCTGDHVEIYPNGQIPLSALCALASAPGQYLRADAAYAFDRLSRAYAARFGRPLCVTDSYRSLAAQVQLYATKPTLAAVPGTSNHGWGTATDLCGGIQSFDTAQHNWMLVNAPLYGWFHPMWAQRNGSKPEPWHWEYGG